MHRGFGRWPTAAVMVVSPYEFGAISLKPWILLGRRWRARRRGVASGAGFSQGRLGTRPGPFPAPVVGAT